jgi:hypothetical protein
MKRLKAKKVKVSAGNIMGWQYLTTYCSYLLNLKASGEQ